MRASECSRLYGEEETEEAGIAEVLNMIKVRDAAEPVDHTTLSQRAIMEALPSFIFFKAKDQLPGDDTAPEEPKRHASAVLELRDEKNPEAWTPVISKRKKKKLAAKKKAKLRGRWVGRGHKQQRGEVLAERVAEWHPQLGELRTAC